jgi:transcriptional antiterminator RfaH
LLKEKENPPIIYPPDRSIVMFSGQWWVVHTKSRNEKALAHELCAREIPYFLPMTLNVSRKTHRRFKSLLPLFTGYLFFCGHDEQRLNVLRTNRVANILDVNDQQKLVSELYQIEKAIRAGAPLVPHQYIQRGQWCRVIAGPLLGLEWIVLD